VWRHAILAASETGVGRPVYAPLFLLSTITSAWLISTRNDTTGIVDVEVDGEDGGVARESRAPPLP